MRRPEWRFRGGRMSSLRGGFMSVVDLGHRWPKSTTMMNAGAGGGGEHRAGRECRAGRIAWARDSSVERGPGARAGSGPRVAAGRGPARGQLPVVADRCGGRCGLGAVRRLGAASVPDDRRPVGPGVQVLVPVAEVPLQARAGPAAALGRGHGAGGGPPGRLRRVLGHRPAGQGGGGGPGPERPQGREGGGPAGRAARVAGRRRAWPSWRPGCAIRCARACPRPAAATGTRSGWRPAWWTRRRRAWRGCCAAWAASPARGTGGRTGCSAPTPSCTC